MGNTSSAKNPSKKNTNVSDSKLKKFLSSLKRKKLLDCVENTEMEDNDKRDKRYFAIDFPLNLDALPKNPNDPMDWTKFNSAKDFSMIDYVKARESKINSNAPSYIKDDPNIVQAYGFLCGSERIIRKGDTRSCLLHDRLRLLKKLTNIPVSSSNPESGLDIISDTVKQLKATGLDISDELLAHLMLIGQMCSDYNWLIKEIDTGKIKVRANAIKQLITEHSNENVIWKYRVDFDMQ